MDKYAWYVIVTYAASFGVLAGYLLWIWRRLKATGSQDAGDAPR
ncbi:heme exporter protein CcmD [Deinococcus multiflagellatus]|uniref:Heme exporter protein D n=1 Tax=Deinococcus multiflagellatus TaxID=1656887 RepID=A0ABW1ZF78_9DEIO|nr:heme exporter protein CcmD [Deinococcus multiflagellatus]MBZ9712776.1 heme exporter protein CcmD [Deinococcus multiflagellatus]